MGVLAAENMRCLSQGLICEEEHAGVGGPRLAEPGAASGHVMLSRHTTGFG